MKRFNSLAAALLIAVGASAAHAQTLGFIDDQPVRNDLLGTQFGLRWLPVERLRQALGVVLLIAAGKLLFAA